MLIMISSSFSISYMLSLTLSTPTPTPPPLTKFHPIKMHYETPPSCSPSVLRRDMWWWCCNDDDDDDDSGDSDGVRVTPCRCPIKHSWPTRCLPSKIMLRTHSQFAATFQKSSSFIFRHLRTCRIWLVCNFYQFSAAPSLATHTPPPRLPPSPPPPPSVSHGPSACASCMTTSEECNTSAMSCAMHTWSVFRRFSTTAVWN